MVRWTQKYNQGVGKGC